MKQLILKSSPACLAAAVFAAALLAAAEGQEPGLRKADDLPFIGSARAREALRRFPSRGARTEAHIKPLEPGETVAGFRLMDGLTAEVVLHEPTVRQPVAIHFDERGRLWIVQLIQYPYPAGVKIIDFDHQFHAVYDRVPPPPPYPKGSPYRGASQVTIHEDADGDGTFDRHKVFLDGLNIVTAVEFGRGGVWVLQPPYLLFYADRDGDDVPDGAPEVHLAGFGLEDTHSTANSLRWGPDGWLYGGHGSGCSATVRRPGLDPEDGGLYFKGQVVWRFHPGTRRLELFAEGGGNTYGLEFDGQGRAFSGHNGGGTRGFHFVQGGFYSKNWGEHGYLTNPYAFGHFNAMPHEGDQARFTHTFVAYEGGTLGERFEGKLIAPMPLHHRVLLSERLPHGSTYRTRDVGIFLSSPDRWFRPVDVKVGPEGAVYLADWYDTRLSHMDPHDTWDKHRGRVYRVRHKDAKPGPVSLLGRGAPELVGLLQHRNRWVRQTALRLLADRPTRDVLPLLARLARNAESPFALDGLWGLHAVGGLTDEVALELLRHPQPAVRMWTVRLLGDPRKAVAAALASALVRLADREPDPQVRGQLAATARRLPGEQALPVLDRMMRRDGDGNDPHLPLMLWWAMEAHAEARAEDVVALFQDTSLWKQPLAAGLVQRLARRYAAYPAPEGQRALRSLLRMAPEAAARRRVVDGIGEAFEGRPATALFAALEETDLNGETDDPARLALAVRAGSAAAVGRALAALGRKDIPQPQRVELVKVLAEARRQEAVPVLLELLRRDSGFEVRTAALAALGRFDDPRLAEGVLKRWADLDARLRLQAAAVLCSRRAWAQHLLRAAVSDGVVSKADLPADLVRRVELLGDAGLTAQVREHFGAPLRSTSVEKDRRIQDLAALLRAGPGGDREAGRALFAQRCGTCHSLFGEGKKLAPDLTGYDRKNLDDLLVHVVDPSAAIREGFGQFHVLTRDGRSLIGVITDKDAARLVLADQNGQVTAVALDQIEQQRPLPTSAMPEGLLDGLTPTQVRDLFAHLTADTPPR